MFFFLPRDTGKRLGEGSRLGSNRDNINCTFQLKLAVDNLDRTGSFGSDHSVQLCQELDRSAVRSTGFVDDAN